VCVDGGLELEMYAAQERLADAYLSSGQAAEARVIAEDLVAREPWEPEHIDRFRRALVMLRVSDPDTLIAERLSGQAPFMARDLFFDPSEVSQPSTVAPAESAVPTPEDAAEGQTPVSAQQTETTPPEVSQAGAIAGTPTPPKPHSAPGDEIDLTGELGELKVVAPTSAEGTPGTLDHVFADMRNKAEADPDYSAQHMILARTYLEIGMVQEAMTSLQNAARSPRQRFEAATALGRLYNREGDTSRAIEWLERAAEAPAPTVDEGRALLYDLGVLLDGSGETSRALAVFLELQADAGDYRDVPARIDRLARVQTGG
jgi:tetratricopeptide (TPR) repeat protein